jgi:AsmA-like C-terminal region
LTRRTKKWLAGIGAAVAAMLVAVSVTGYILARRIEPFIREQVIAYLHDRFDSEVEIAALSVRVRRASLVETLLNRGHGLIATVEGDGVQLRHRGRRDLPPMFAMKQFRFDVELRTLLDRTKVLHLVTVDGMEINVPPKGQRPDLGSGGDQNIPSNVLLEEVLITNATLAILPNNSKKFPLRFDIHRMRLESAGQHVAMKYEAALTNAKPRGEIQSNGTLGPWVADEPGDSHLAGVYNFTNADLGVFSGIAGTLESSGQFEGTLSSVNVKGEATVPDFRLKEVGNPVRLQTRFEVRVDGTSGDTVLKPVNGSLGATSFRTSGGIIRHESDLRRTISLNVSMPSGNIHDLLSLAMKGTPFMRGKISLNTKIDIPPLTGSVREKLLLDGQFQLSQARFLKSTVQDQIDTLSRRGRGQPGNTDISGVVSVMAGKFTLANEMVTFQSLSFAVPGSGVDLAGTYDLDRDTLDFHGTLRLQAKVSETMTGWKRWVLKPIDPFFSKQGAGTLLRIQVVGTSKEPKFGRDRGKATGTD